jgi:hypothetical protein
MVEKRVAMRHRPLFSELPVYDPLHTMRVPSLLLILFLALIHKACSARAWLRFHGSEAHRSNGGFSRRIINEMTCRISA